MEYRLFVETCPAETATGWAFMIFNHQDFNVYKFCGKSDSTDEKAVTLEVAARALNYFSNFMRRRYYDEHFATILDEDRITLFTKYPEIAACRATEAYKKGFTGADRALWEALVPFFERPTVFFETANGEKFVAMAKALAKEGLSKA